MWITVNRILDLMNVPANCALLNTLNTIKIEICVKKDLTTADSYSKLSEVNFNTISYGCITAFTNGSV